MTEEEKKLHEEYMNFHQDYSKIVFDKNRNYLFTKTETNLR
jgi:hypothetical protein